MRQLIIGFDSAWTGKNQGGIAAAILNSGGVFLELGTPINVDFNKAGALIEHWRQKHKPAKTLIMIDQPTIVRNKLGQRCVEKIVSSPIGTYLGGVQPANTGKASMFGKGAPIWEFFEELGGPSNPYHQLHTRDVEIYEVFPALALISLDWIHPPKKIKDQLPKYNPANKNFSICDWQYVCGHLSTILRSLGLSHIPAWIDLQSIGDRKPKKLEQDCLDACICLLIAILAAKKENLLVVGNMNCGYMVTPFNQTLQVLIDNRCARLGLDPGNLVTSRVLT
jgi:predicted RNase H-like nuclease